MVAGKSSGCTRLSPNTVTKVDVAVRPRHGVNVLILLDPGAGSLPEIDADGALMLTFSRVRFAVENPTAHVCDSREPSTQVVLQKILQAEPVEIGGSLLTLRPRGSRSAGDWLLRRQSP